MNNITKLEFKSEDGKVISGADFLNMLCNVTESSAIITGCNDFYIQSLIGLPNLIDESFKPVYKAKYRKEDTPEYIKEELGILIFMAFRDFFNALTKDINGPKEFTASDFIKAMTPIAKEIQEFVLFKYKRGVLNL
jgi:hypothetical protein